MDQNPYAPPVAPVRVVTEPDAAAGAPPLFSVGLPKLAIMSLGTFGVYSVYWFYRQWKALKEQGLALGAAPLARAIFALFFCYQCFAKIRELGEQRMPESRLPAGPLATTWIVLSLAGRAPSPWYVLAFFSVGCLLPVQAYADRLNEQVAPGHDRNSRIRGWNWLAVGIGLPCLVIGLLGMLLPDGEGGR